MVPIDDQLSTALCPSTIVVGVTVIVMLAGGAGETVGGSTGNEADVPNEQLKKEEACAQIARRPAHQRSTLER
jgi:hypothetical protein